jgi:hypothetical protein
MASRKEAKTLVNFYLALPTLSCSATKIQEKHEHRNFGTKSALCNATKAVH